jgi:hypothetical protein
MFQQSSTVTIVGNLHVISLLEPGTGRGVPGATAPAHGRRVVHDRSPILYGDSAVVRTFMAAYFRYLSTAHTSASRRTTFSLAIAMVRHDRCAATRFRSRHPSSPTAAKVKAALIRAAAMEARQPEPDVLAGFMTAQYPSNDLRDALVRHLCFFYMYKRNYTADLLLYIICVTVR